MKFQDLRLGEPIVRAVANQGYTTPTPIQREAIPHVVDGRDLLGCAQTGSGKTAAFALPILQRLSHSGQKSEVSGQQEGRNGHRNGKPKANNRTPRALILCPTRELAAQIEESFRTYGRNLSVRCAVVFGGVSQYHQVRALQSGIDVLIATPGRLQDLMEQGHIDLRAVEVLVLDEADRMLDMGFIPDIRRIVKHVPAERQTLLFSATMPDDIRHLADSLLRNPVRVDSNRNSATVETVEQSVYFVPRNCKPALLAHLLKQGGMERTLVFTRTKHGADRVVRQLEQSGIRAAAIHGNKAQNARMRALASFKSHNPPVLVATDIASRGIDVDDITHVVNYDIPNVAETYVHRIGRTARAGASGFAVSFCDREECEDLRAIERLTRANIELIPTPRDLPVATSAGSRSFERDGHRGNGRPRPARQPARGGSQPRSSRPSSPRQRDDSPHTASRPKRGFQHRGRGRHTGRGARAA